MSQLWIQTLCVPQVWNQDRAASFVLGEMNTVTIGVWRRPEGQAPREEAQGVSSGINYLQGLWLLFSLSEAHTAGTPCTFDLAFQAWVMPGNCL